jgi:hypothetical protein
MKRTLLLAAIVAAAGVIGQAQDAQTAARAEGRGEATARAGDQLEIASGTRLTAQLQQTLDVRKARVGDEVVLKTAEAVKSNGRTVVKKGAKLFGRVTEVHARAKGEAESRIGLVFDRLESGSLATPITATIAAVTQADARAQGRAGDDDFGTVSGGGSGRASGGGSAQGGGLLGGVGSTVGGVTSTAGGVAGGVVDTTTGAVGQTVGTAGNAAGGLGRTVRGLRVTQSTNAEASGSSTLSLTGGDLKLEKNTTFHLVVSQSANVNNN